MTLVLIRLDTMYRHLLEAGSQFRTSSVTGNASEQDIHDFNGSSTLPKRVRGERLYYFGTFGLSRAIPNLVWLAVQWDLPDVWSMSLLV